MSTAEQEGKRVGDAAVFDWRFEVLIEAGYLPDEALILASSSEVDVHLAERLLVQGCPRSTAVRILH